MGWIARLLWVVPVLTALMLPILPTPPAMARIRTCGPFYLKDTQGNTINPMTGENADHPFSTRQTCGGCHDYDRITRGYHFQQGWDRIRDDFDPTRPWILSDGMMGKQ